MDILSANNIFPVDISNVRFSQENRLIFNNINLQIARGKITAIMGPSGSGKTTLLRLIGGLISPDNGIIKVEGYDINKLSKKNLYKLRQKIGLLFQNSALFSHLSVFENVAFPLREHMNLNFIDLSNRVLEKLEAVGLSKAEDLMPAALSGGMARRVALARSIILDPSLIMYDEPFTGQDPISMGVLVKLIKNINQILKTTTIIVSHDVQETCSIADYIYLLSNGKIIAAGTPEELLVSTQDEVRQFMHGEADGLIPFHYAAKSPVEELFDA